MASILVVDDEAGIRDFLTDALVGDGHEAVSAADGVQALHLIRAREFDLMITDLKMPGPLDGVDLLRQSRAERPDMEVVVLTAHGTIETAVEAMKLGAFDFLEKPLGSLAELRTLIRRGLARRALAARTPGRRVARRLPRPSGNPMEELAREVAATLGPDYEIEAVIGRGGYAVVFRVYDRPLDRKLAAKTLYPEFAAVATIADQFRREARTAARLNHPNIVPVYFVARDGEVPSLVMPLIEGESLSARIARERQLDLQQVLRIAGDVANALDYAHRSGIVHRDVKPDNILLEASSGRSLLTDFGIAKALTNDSVGTMPGVVMGTPYYVSPEQAAGAPDVDSRSDLYSFAVVVYEMLAGAPPFDGGAGDGSRAQRVFAQHVVATPPSLLTKRPGLDPRVDAVMTRALAKDPTQRFADAAQFVAALERASGVGRALESTGTLAR